jgi:hypothetical protein
MLPRTACRIVDLGSGAKGKYGLYNYSGGRGPLPSSIGAISEPLLVYDEAYDS